MKTTYWMSRFNKLLILDLESNKYFQTNGIIISLESDFTFTELHLRHYILKLVMSTKDVEKKNLEKKP